MGGRNFQRQKRGILSVIIYREPPPPCSVTVFGNHKGIIVARGRPTPSGVGERDWGVLPVSENFSALLRASPPNHTRKGEKEMKRSREVTCF